MSMPKWVEVLPWVAANKDALLALGACLAPVTSIIAAAVSYRAVVTGPRVQMRIARQQNKLAERQQALHEKQFALTQQQLRFTMIGTPEQKWISGFQEMLGSLFEIGFRSSIIHMTMQRKLPDSQQEQNKLIDLQHQAVALISKIWIHLGRDVIEVKPDIERARACNDDLSLQNYIQELHMQFEVSQNAVKFPNMLRSWLFPNEQFDHSVWSEQEQDIFKAAQRIISIHQAKIEV
jgi:hypothetical protein